MYITINTDRHDDFNRRTFRMSGRLRDSEDTQMLLIESTEWKKTGRRNPETTFHYTVKDSIRLNIRTGEIEITADVSRNKGEVYPIKKTYSADQYSVSFINS